MIKLTGSEKQIAWADSIIGDALKTIELNKTRVSNEYPEGAYKAKELNIWDTIGTQYNDALSQLEKMPKNAAIVIDKRDTFGPDGIIYASNQMEKMG